MIRHEQFKLMLVWPDELSVAEAAALNRHLDDCSDCRSAATLYAENRARLRALAQLRPPAELREAILDAAEETQAGFYVPAIVSFLTVPLSLLAVAGIFAYGLAACLWLLAGILVLAVLATWQGHRREAAAEMPLERDAGGRILPLLRLLAIDLLGVIAGGALVGLFMILLLAVGSKL